VERLADENATISREHGFPLWFAFSDVHLGWAAVHQGQGADCINSGRFLPGRRSSPGCSPPRSA
jgi:hypothetical protein